VGETAGVAVGVGVLVGLAVAVGGRVAVGVGAGGALLNSNAPMSHSLLEGWPLPLALRA
jgi:hypothetical protein